MVNTHRWMMKSFVNNDQLHIMACKALGTVARFCRVVFFDREHNPSYHLIEGLLYPIDYYKPYLQSVSFGIVSAEY
jgi:hypothetical protein